jgi:hypothetical protein
MTKDLFTRQQHNIIGPGGLKCQCCNDYYGKKKPVLNRIKRRKLKQQTKKEFFNYL